MAYPSSPNRLFSPPGRARPEQVVGIGATSRRFPHRNGRTAADRPIDGFHETAARPRKRLPPADSGTAAWQAALPHTQAGRRLSSHVVLNTAIRWRPASNRETGNSGRRHREARPDIERHQRRTPKVGDHRVSKLALILEIGRRLRTPEKCSAGHSRISTTTPSHKPYISMNGYFPR